MNRLTELSIMLKGAEECLVELLHQDARECVYQAARQRCAAIRAEINERIPDGTLCETDYRVSEI